MSETEINWKDIPAELQSMIIKYMDNETRLNYSLCSMRCRNQAAGKEEFVHGLFVRIGFNDDDQQIITLDVYYGDDEDDDMPALSNMDYSIQFREIGAKKKTKKAEAETLVEITKHVRVPYVENKPKSTMVRSGDFGDIISKYVNQYIKRYQKCLRRLRIEVEIVDVEKLELDELTNLEELVSVDYTQHRNLLFNTTDKLKRLLLKYKNGNYFNDRGNLTREMLKYNIWKVQTLSLTDTIFDEDEFLSLKAVEMDLAVGEIESETINAVIRSWSEGEYKQDFKWLRLRISSKNPNQLDMEKVLEELKYTEVNKRKNAKTLTYRVTHQQDAKKHMDIVKTARELTLIVDQNAYTFRDHVGERGPMLYRKREHTCEACEYESSSKKKK